MAKKHSSPLLAQLDGSLLMVEPGSAELFQSCINHVITHEHAAKLIDARSDIGMSDDDFWGDDSDPHDWLHAYRPYTVINGVLQIPVMGVLLSQFPWQLGRWATGYKYIEMCFRRGLEDDNVKGFALVCNSPGGDVTECFELGDKMYEWGKQKPIRAFVANAAYSACFNLASAAGPDNIVITRSGGAGSVGVVTMHVEYSKAMEEWGVKVTYIFAGEHKVDGNPYEKLSAAAKTRIQARIDKIYGVFTSTVARNRDMEEADVRATEALTYDAEEAIEIGFADRIGALEEELVVYTTELANDGDEYMAQPNVTGKKPGTEEQATFTQDQVDAMINEATAAAAEEAHAEGVEQERARASAIRALPEAEGKPSATDMLIDLGVSAEVAKTKLAKMPVEVAAKTEQDDDTNAITGKTNAKGKDHFADAMNKTKQPNISATTGDDEDEDEDSPQAKTNAILGAYGAMSGKSRKKVAA